MLIGGLDIGTTGCKIVLFNINNTLIRRKISDCVAANLSCRYSTAVSSFQKSLFFKKS